jgi:hypothetical protein
VEETEHLSVYRQVITAISQGNAQVLDDLLTSDMVDHNPMPQQSPGRDGFKEWMAAARTSFPDLHGTIEEVMASA